MAIYSEKAQHRWRCPTQKTYNTYGVDLHTTRITEGRLTTTLGYKTYNAYSVELKWHSNLCHVTR